MNKLRTSYWKIKLSLFLNYFIFAILLNSVGTVILQVINHYDITKSAAGNLDAYKDLTIALFSFFAASFLPRMGYKVSMLLGLALVSIACFLTPVINDYWMIKLLLICVGISFALIKVSAYSTVGLITQDEQSHASFISIMEGIFMFGVLSGYWLFGEFISSKQYSWIDTFWVIGGLSTLAFLLLFTTPLDETGTTYPRSTMREDFLSMLKLTYKPLVLLFILSIFMYVFIEQGITTWLPTFNNKVLHFSPAMSVEMASLLSLALGLGRIAAGFIMKKVDWFWLLITFLALSTLMITLFLPGDPIVRTAMITEWKQAPLIAYVFPFIGFFLAPIYPTLVSTMISTLPKYRHSAMMGLVMIFSALGGTLGSKLVGIIFGIAGGEKAIGFTLIPMVILFVLLFPYRTVHNRNLIEMQHAAK